jgi:fido (protein-threonine AMPylation protein)
MKGSHFAGRYRSMDVSISKSEHAPFPEYAIDPTMQDYASWSKRDCHPDLAVLRAAVGHAWFTHVHPFYDGNGRVARLTTNVMLGQDGLPPAIVKAKSQRGQYLAALAHSDEGGDILPLVGLFLSTVERYVADLSRPKAFKKMFDDLVARRGNSYFAFYAECVSQFVKRLATELALYDLTLVRVDQLTREDFDNLRTTISGDYGSYYSWPSQRRRRPSPVMTAVIADAKGNEVVLYQTLATAESRRQLTPEEYVPSFGFALPDRKFRLMPHRRATRSEMSGLGSLWVLPGRSVHVFAPGVLPNRGSRLEEATGVIAARLRQAFAAGFSTPEDHLGSTRWLPRINGGQL